MVAWSEGIRVVVADVAVCDVADAAELELVILEEEVEEEDDDEEVAVVEEVDAVVEDASTIHWLFWQL